MVHLHRSSQPAVKFVTRLPVEIKERLAVAALCNHRSMNSEIICILERVLPPIESPAQQDPE
jgi:plasmid stability protein